MLRIWKDLEKVPAPIFKKKKKCACVCAHVCVCCVYSTYVCTMFVCGMCMCAHVYSVLMCMQCGCKIHVHECTHLWTGLRFRDQRTKVSCPPLLLSALSLWVRVSHWTESWTIPSGQPGSQASNVCLSVSTPQCWGSRHAHPCTAFNMCVGNSNSGLRACTVSTLHTKLSVQPFSRNFVLQTNWRPWEWDLRDVSSTGVTQLKITVLNDAALN